MRVEVPRASSLFGDTGIAVITTTPNSGMYWSYEYKGWNYFTHPIPRSKLQSYIA